MHDSWHALGKRLVFLTETSKNKSQPALIEVDGKPVPASQIAIESRQDGQVIMRIATRALPLNPNRPGLGNGRPRKNRPTQKYAQSV